MSVYNNLIYKLNVYIMKSKKNIKKVKPIIIIDHIVKIETDGPFIIDF